MPVRSTVLLCACSIIGRPEFLHIQPDVALYLPEERGGDVAFCIERYRCPASIRVTVLSVRAALPDYLKAQGQKAHRDFSGLEDGNLSDLYATRTVWMPTNSDSMRGSPSSRSISIASWRFDCSSSSVAPWLCAPGHPGTEPTYNPVSPSRSITTLKARVWTSYKISGGKNTLHPEGGTTSRTTEVTGGRG